MRKSQPSRHKRVIMGGIATARHNRIKEIAASCSGLSFSLLRLWLGEGTGYIHAPAFK